MWSASIRGGWSHGRPDDRENGAGWCPENPLLRLLESQRRRASLTRRELAARLGLSPGSSVSVAESRPFPRNPEHGCHSPRCRIPRAASVILCLVLAGRLTPADFLRQSDAFDAALATALANVASSPWGLEAAVTPGQLQALPREVQWLLIRLAEKAGGVSLLPGRLGAADYERAFAYCTPFSE